MLSGQDVDQEILTHVVSGAARACGATRAVLTYTPPYAPAMRVSSAPPGPTAARVSHPLKDHMGVHVGDLSLESDEPHAWSAEDQEQLRASGRVLEALLEGARLAADHERTLADRNRATVEILRLASFPRDDPTPVFEVRGKGEIAYSNPAAERAFPDEAQLALALADLGAGRAEIAVGARTYERMAVPIAGGRAWHVYLWDVSDRIRADKLRHEASLRALIENIRDVILLVDDAGRVRYASPALAARFGVAPSDVVGSRFLALIHPDDADAALGVLASGAEAGLRLRDATGAWRHVEAVGGERSDGQLVLTLQDVTERRRLEEETRLHREAASRAERLSALGTLVAGVAHEINNPLTYIDGNLCLAREALQEARGVQPTDALAEANEALETAAKGVDRIARIVKALRVVARKGEGVRRSVDAFEILSDVAVLVEPSLPPGVVLAFERGAPVRAMGSDAELHQVALNLVKNAIEAVPAPGGVVRLDARRDGDRVEIVVEDNGPGIPPDLLQQLFTPFLTTKASGTGLGLSLVHAIVRDHDGEILVESTPGKGARFRVRLPPASHP